MTKPLTAKQQRFVEEYLIDLNATQAAIRAGYSEKTAQEQSSRLLSNVMVTEAIAEGQQRRSEKTEINAERVLQELASIGFADLRGCFTPGGHLVDVQDWPDELAHAISSVEVVTKPGDVDADGNRTVEHVHKIKLWDKNSALEKIAKHLGMFVERHEHTGKGGGPIETKDVSDVEFARRMAFLMAKGAAASDDGNA